MANIKTTTRKGLKVTCPECHRVQEGPGAVDRILKENEDLRTKLNRKHTPPPVTTKSAPTRRVTIRSAPPPAHQIEEPAASEEIASAPAAVPAPRRHPIDRFLFGGD